MRLPLGLLLAALALPAFARAPDFEALAGSAEKLDTLEPFLQRYVGHCTDIYERRTCEQNVAQARKAASGKTFVIRVADAASLVRPQLDGDRFVLLLTPFVDGGGLALTHGAPAKADAAGRPVMNLIPIKGTLPPGTMEMEFESPFRVGAIELEIVFRPEKTWKLARKGEPGARKGEPGSYEGVAAQFLGVRVIDARTGNAIAAKVL